MGKLSTEISAAHKKFIEAQQMFFVATAPLSPQGHISLSPKGLEHLIVLNPNQVIYLDLVGSGNETSAHLLENNRITFMFCSYKKVPNILRLYGTGNIILPTDPQWQNYIKHFQAKKAIRQIIIANIYHVQTSCGYGVPLYDYKGTRTTLQDWANHKGEDGLAAYIKENNMQSIDGLKTHYAAKQNP